MKTFHLSFFKQISLLFHYMKINILKYDENGNKFKVPQKNLNIPQNFYWVLFIIFMIDSENVGKFL